MPATGDNVPLAAGASCAEFQRVIHLIIVVDIPDHALRRAKGTETAQGDSRDSIYVGGACDAKSLLQSRLADSAIEKEWTSKAQMEFVAHLRA